VDDTLCRQFFTQPALGRHRQYEALRAVFLDGLSQKDVAARFGYSYDAFRQLVHAFRHDCNAGNPPPFSTGPGADVLPPSQPRRRSACPSLLPMREP
jgi:transposase